MNIVILDGYSANPGDLSWDELKEMGNVTVYDRTSPSETIARTIEADGSNRYFDLQGRQIKGKPVKGIYIKDGKKFINK